jgi:iron complex outermembrane receptor protein
MTNRQNRRICGRLSVLTALLFLATAPLVSAQAPQDLGVLNLEELANIEVITVSRTPDTLAHAPAPVYVITHEDIRRSGARNIPEALRLAPGVQVARIDAAHWAIGIRGFAGPLNRSVLVQIDGRAVYDPLFAGTYWDVQDTLLEDIDRIEVIRGPGGTLWGANAINGIISIITKAAGDTRGAVVTSRGGSSEYGSFGVRYGGASGNVAYRAYGQATHRGPGFHASNQNYDSWRAGQGGFRVDRTLASGRALTVQGDFYKARSGTLATSTTYASPFTSNAEYDATLSGGNVLMRWSSPNGAKTPFQLQAYYDRTNRHDIPITEHRDTLDLDFQQTRKHWTRHELVWGLGFRVTSGRITAVEPTRFSPAARRDELSSGFLQDTITLIPERLRLAGGAKLEHNSYSGFELQPSGRLVWTPNATNTIIGSVTRAVRTPSPAETDYTNASFSGMNQGLAVFVRLQPNAGFVSEKLTAYEAVYRLQPAAPVFVRVASFYNQLDDILSAELRTPFLEVAPAPPHIILPIEFGNGLQGSSYGGEVTADLRASRWWRVTATYSHVRVALSKTAGSNDIAAERQDEGSSPRHQWQLRSSFDLRRGWSADWLVRYASVLLAGPVPSYVTSNARIAWQPNPRVEFALVGTDLHRAHHLEWPGGAGGSVEVPRSGYATATWKW